jgi:hypothetical protein
MPTAPDEADTGKLQRSRLVRRGFVVVLVGFLTLGMLNVYGVRTRERTGAGGGYELTVRYAGISRPGLATPWSVDVSRPGGFPDGVTLAVTSSYFDGFDENGLDPSPVEETNDGERSIWRFGPSVGDTLSVSFDARIEPGVQLTRLKGSVSVLGGTGAPAVTVEFSTLVMP